MDGWVMLRSLGRSWFVVIPIVLLSVFAAWIVRDGIDETYEAGGSFLIVKDVGSPEESPGLAVGRPGEESIDERNPDSVADPAWNAYAGSLTTTGQALGLVLASPGARDAVADAGGSPTYQIYTSNRHSIITVVAEAPDPQRAIETVRIIEERYREELAARQLDAGVSPDVTVQPLTTSAVSADRVGGAGRVMIAIVLAGLVLAGLAGMAVERWRRRRADPLLTQRDVLVDLMSLLEAEQERLLGRQR